MFPCIQQQCSVNCFVVWGDVSGLWCLGSMVFLRTHWTIEGETKVTLAVTSAQPVVDERFSVAVVLPWSTVWLCWLVGHAVCFLAPSLSWSWALLRTAAWSIVLEAKLSEKSFFFQTHTNPPSAPTSASNVLKTCCRHCYVKLSYSHDKSFCHKCSRQLTASENSALRKDFVDTIRNENGVYLPGI